MNRMYNVGNANHIGFWCAAASPEQAVAIALRARHVRKPATANVTDVTDAMLARDSASKSLRLILAQGTTGRLTKRMQSMTMQQVVQGVSRTEWVVQPIEA